MGPATPQLRSSTRTPRSGPAGSFTCLRSRRSDDPRVSSLSLVRPRQPRPPRQGDSSPSASWVSVDWRCLPRPQVWQSGSIFPCALTELGLNLLLTCDSHLIEEALVMGRFESDSVFTTPPVAASRFWSSPRMVCSMGRCFGLESATAKPLRNGPNPHIERAASGVHWIPSHPVLPVQGLGTVQPVYFSSAVLCHEGSSHHVGA